MVSLAVYTQSLLLVFVALFPVSFCDAAETKCYNFDGTPADASFKPCNGTAGVSMCCQLGEASNGGDTCGSGSSYGLCVTGLGSQLWRRSCTDSSWRDPRCLPLCIAGNGISTPHYRVIAHLILRQVHMPTPQSQNAAMGVIAADKTRHHAVKQIKECSS